MEYVDEQLSLYYLTLEVAQVATGMEIALGTEPWEIFQQMTPAEFAAQIKRDNAKWGEIVKSTDVKME